jgi:hypothetical protein
MLPSLVQLRDLSRAARCSCQDFRRCVVCQAVVKPDCDQLLARIRVLREHFPPKKDGMSMIEQQIEQLFQSAEVCDRLLELAPTPTPRPLTLVFAFVNVFEAFPRS